VEAAVKAFMDKNGDDAKAYMNVVIPRTVPG